MIVEFLSKSAEKQYTIEEIAENLSLSVGRAAPGRSSVYRLINKMLSEGIVKRFVRENSRHFYYQLVDGKECRIHLHMKCAVCSRLIHLDNDTTEEITALLMKKKGFGLDTEKTVFFGICSECR